MRPLRILAIGHAYVISSNRAIVERTAERYGHDITIAAPSFFHGDLREVALEPLKRASVRLVGIPAHFTNHVHIFFYRELGKLIQKGAFDLIQAWEEPYILAGFQIARCAQRAGIPYVFRTAQSLQKWYPPPFQQFENYCTGIASGWIAGGHLVQQNLLARGYPQRNAEVITLAVDESLFRPDASARAAARAALDIAQDEPVVGFIGRLSEEKGLDILMQALDRIPGRWTLLALGSGPYEQRLHEWAINRGTPERLRIKLATHDQVPHFLQAADLVAAPSQTTSRWKEQFGRMIIEAFACRIPVVGSDSGEIPFVIGDAGTVLPEGDISAWAETIGTLLSSPERRLELAEAGYERCQKLYTASSVCERYNKFYEQVISGEVVSEDILIRRAASA